MKKSEKIFTATARLADALARRMQFPDAISGGCFRSFTYARNLTFSVGPASERRRAGVGAGFPKSEKLIFSKFLSNLQGKERKK